MKCKILILQIFTLFFSQLSLKAATFTKVENINLGQFPDERWNFTNKASKGILAYSLYNNFAKIYLFNTSGQLIFDDFNNNQAINQIINLALDSNVLLMLKIYQQGNTKTLKFVNLDLDTNESKTVTISDDLKSFEDKDLFRNKARYDFKTNSFYVLFVEKSTNDYVLDQISFEGKITEIYRQDQEFLTIDDFVIFTDLKGHKDLYLLASGTSLYPSIYNVILGIPVPVYYTVGMSSFDILGDDKRVALAIIQKNNPSIKLVNLDKQKAVKNIAKGFFAGQLAKDFENKILSDDGDLEFSLCKSENNCQDYRLYSQKLITEGNDSVHGKNENFIYELKNKNQTTYLNKITFTDKFRTNVARFDCKSKIVEQDAYKDNLNIIVFANELCKYSVPKNLKLNIYQLPLD